MPGYVHHMLAEVPPTPFCVSWPGPIQVADEAKQEMASTALKEMTHWAHSTIFSKEIGCDLGRYAAMLQPTQINMAVEVVCRFRVKRCCRTRYATA